LVDRPVQREVVGAQFGRYEILRPIAEGGMAQVYLGVRRGAGGFQKKVVVKVLHSRYLGDRDFVRMFLDEARILSRIHHPNVVDVYEVESVDGVAYMAMEHVNGPTLNDLHKASLRTCKHHLGFFLHLVRQVCDGLAAAHALQIDGAPARVVHRDVSSQNVLVEAATGNAKLIDFGIAKVTGALHDQTLPGVVKGKLQYVAPEAMDGAPYDARADVYAVGVLLYRIIAGRMPYRDSDLTGGRRGPPHRPLEEVTGLPAGLADIVDRAMAVDPNERYPSASALSEDLGRVVSALGVDPFEIPRWIASIYPGGEEDWSRRGDSQGATSVHSSLRRLVEDCTPPTVVPSAPRQVAFGAIAAVALIATATAGWLGWERARAPEVRAAQVSTLLDVADELLADGHVDAAQSLNARASALDTADVDVAVRVARQRARIEERSER
jgi:eukaryotic-like serine/threonine-protein kinase